MSDTPLEPSCRYHSSGARSFPRAATASSVALPAGVTASTSTASGTDHFASELVRRLQSERPSSVAPRMLATEGRAARANATGQSRAEPDRDTKAGPPVRGYPARRGCPDDRFATGGPRRRERRATAHPVMLKSRFAPVQICGLVNASWAQTVGGISHGLAVVALAVVVDPRSMDSQCVTPSRRASPSPSRG